MDSPAAVHAVVQGRVQGVYFRAFAARRARELGLTGYTRNLPDGSVEIRAEGETEQLQRLLDHLEIGPPYAGVEKVLTNWSEYTGDYSRFTVRY